VSRKGYGPSPCRLFLTDGLWIVIGAAAAVVVALIGLGVGLAILFSSGPKPNGGGKEPLRVDPKDAKAFHTIQEAVNRARSSDHIV